MPSSQFYERVNEIEKYYSFLNSITALKVTVTVERNNKKTISSVDRDLVRILKANAFLLLYNLVEASVREGITQIYDALQSDALTYVDLRDELRRIWLNEMLTPEARRLPDAMISLVQELLQSAIDNERVTFSSSSLPISGNLDARKVRELANAYGFAHTSHSRTRGGFVLHAVKVERNNLAHGHRSFVECGRDVTFSTLKQTKSQLIRYLENILRNMEAYIQTKAYKRL